MKTITREMIKDYGIKKKQYDFMGYTFNNRNYLSFHHLIVPHKDCKAMGLGEGYFFWNGAILVQDTSHEYLHLIQRIDEPMFLYVTQLLIKENKLGQLDLNIIKEIRSVLLEFENQHKDDRHKKDNRLLIKPKYISERLPFKGTAATYIPTVTREEIYSQIPIECQTEPLVKKLKK